MKLHESFLGGGFLLGSSNAVIYGCTDSNASNYNPLATNDDNSCIACVYGCTNPLATNYDSAANCDDGSCIASTYGCMDPNAFNYNPNATINQVSFFNTNDPCLPVVSGCTIPQSINYNPNANTDDGSCVPIVYGCTDPLASNYNSNANTDDGTCVTPSYSCSTESNNMLWNTTESFPGDNNSSVYITISPVYVVTPLNDTYLQNFNIPVIYSDFQFNNFDLYYKSCSDTSYTYVYTPVGSANLIDNLNLSTSHCYDFKITASCDYLGNANYTGNPVPHDYFINGVTTQAAPTILGCTDPLALNYDSNANTNDGSCNYSGCTDPNANNYDPNANIDDGSCVYPVIYGCTNNLYVNYDPTATNACDDFNGPGCVNNQTGSNCCCDQVIYYGCTDTNAVNYDANSNTLCTDSSDPLQNNNNQPCTECIYPYQVGCMNTAVGHNPDVNGWCSDGDGWPTYVNSTFAGVGSLGGCFNNNGYLVSNYNPEALMDSAPTACITDVFGCTDDTSCTYNPNATFLFPPNVCTSASGFCPSPSAINLFLGSNDPETEIGATFTTDCSDNSNQANLELYQGSTLILTIPNYVSGQIIPNLQDNTTYTVKLQNVCSNNVGNSSYVLSNITTQLTIVSGCTDDQANNYDPNANADCTSGPGCLQNPVPNCCCTYDVLGCTDPNASNYNSNANIDDGSCYYNGCTDTNAINYDSNATVDDGSCVYCPDLQALSGQTQWDTNVVNAINGRLSFSTTYSSLGGTAQGIKFSIGNIYDSTANSNVITDPNWQNAGIQRISIAYSSSSNIDPQQLPFNNYSGSGVDDGWHDPGNGQFTTAEFNSNGNIQLGGLAGGQQIQAYLMTHCDQNHLPNNNTTSIPQRSTVSMTPITITTPDLAGCTDVNAVNYNSNVNLDDGSCTYPSVHCDNPVTGLTITDWTKNEIAKPGSNIVGYIPKFEWNAPAVSTGNLSATVYDYMLWLCEDNGYYYDPGTALKVDPRKLLPNEGFRRGDYTPSTPFKPTAKHRFYSHDNSYYNDPLPSPDNSMPPTPGVYGNGGNINWWNVKSAECPTCNIISGQISSTAIEVEPGVTAGEYYNHGGFYNTGGGRYDKVTYGNGGTNTVNSGYIEDIATRWSASMLQIMNIQDTSYDKNSVAHFGWKKNINGVPIQAGTAEPILYNKFFEPPFNRSYTPVSMSHYYLTTVRARVTPGCDANYNATGYPQATASGTDLFSEIRYIAPSYLEPGQQSQPGEADDTFAVGPGTHYPWPRPDRIAGVLPLGKWDPSQPNTDVSGIVVRMQINNGCHWGGWDLQDFQLLTRKFGANGDSSQAFYNAYTPIQYGPIPITFDPYCSGGSPVETNPNVLSTNNKIVTEWSWQIDAYGTNPPGEPNAAGYNIYDVNDPNNIHQCQDNNGNTFDCYSVNRQVNYEHPKCAAYINVPIPGDWVDMTPTSLGLNSWQDFIHTHGNTGQFGSMTLANHLVNLDYSWSQHQHVHYFWGMLVDNLVQTEWTAGTGCLAPTNPYVQNLFTIPAWQLNGNLSNHNVEMVAAWNGAGGPLGSGPSCFNSVGAGCYLPNQYNS